MSKKTEKSEKKLNIVNFYTELPKGMAPTYHNPNYDKVKIKHPFYAGIYGGTGSMKTNTLLNLLKQMNGTWEKIILCVKSAEEPLYKWLKAKIPPTQLEIYENGVVPDVDKYIKCPEQMLIVFDDLVNMKNQKPIEEWFLRGRKCEKGCSMIYLSQSYFQTKKFIRIQQNLIFLKRLTSSRDLNLVISDFGLMGQKKDIIKAYKDTVNESKENFFLICIEAEPGERFRKNFDEMLPIKEDI
jgi:hypothetical protein